MQATLPNLKWHPPAAYIKLSMPETLALYKKMKVPVYKCTAKYTCICNHISAGLLKKKNQQNAWEVTSRTLSSNVNPVKLKDEVNTNAPVQHI